MMQFYFLSILLNAASGAILAAGQDTDSPETSLLPSFLGREIPRLALGALTMLAGFFKLLTPTKGDVPVLGDLVPALLGLGAGFVLVFDFYRSRRSIEDEGTERFAGLITKYRKFIGFAALGSSVLHFFFPETLFL